MTMTWGFVCSYEAFYFTIWCCVYADQFQRYNDNFVFLRDCSYAMKGMKMECNDCMSVNKLYFTG